MRLFPSPDGDASKAGLLGRARSAPPLLSDERWSASLEILAQHVIELHSMGSEQIDLRGRATVARLARRYDSAVTLYEQILELEPENELALAYGYRCAVKAHRLRRAHRFAKRLDDLGHFGPLEEMRRASSHFGRD